MAFTAGPWDGLPWGEPNWRAFFGEYGPTRCLDVGTVVASPSDRTVTISGLVAIIQGALAEQSGTDVVTIPTPTGSNKRIDTICLQYDPSANSVTVVRVGTEGVNPSPPTLTQDPNGIWQSPIYEIGPYGVGPVGAAPYQDYRLYAGRVISAYDIERVRRQGAQRGDLVFLPPSRSGGSIFYHDGSQLRSYFEGRAEVFSTSDSGYPRRVEGFTNQITNSLTVPARDYDRALMISATHWLRVPAGPAEYDSWMRIDGNHVREFRHPREQDISSASSASMSVPVTLPARRSMRILTGFTRASSSGAAAISSSTRAANNINVLATPA